VPPNCIGLLVGRQVHLMALCKISIRLKKDIVNRLTDQADNFKRLAERNLPQTTRRLLLENYKMNSRLLSVSRDMVDLGVENKHLDWQKLNQLDRIHQCRLQEAKFTNKNVANQTVLHLTASNVFNNNNNNNNNNKMNAIDVTQSRDFKGT